LSRNSDFIPHNRFPHVLSLLVFLVLNVSPMLSSLQPAIVVETGSRLAGLHRLETPTPLALRVAISIESSSAEHRRRALGSPRSQLLI
jgi:hypothetical protein